MLQRLPDHARNALELADFIEKLPAHEFDMNHFARCAGWHCARRFTPVTKGFVSGRDAIGKYLGVKEPLEIYSAVNRTQTETVNMLRHLAETGQVKW